MNYFTNLFDYDLRYVHAPKCSSRTTLAWMVLMREPHLYENNPNWFMSVPDKRNHAYKDIKRRIQKHDFYETFYDTTKITFCIKRDPVKRFISAYQNMRWLGELGNNIEKIINNWDDLIMNRPVLKEHFRTQTSCYGTHAIYSHLFKHDRMNEVKEFLEDYASIKLPNLHLQQSGEKEEVKLTDEQIKWIKEKYKEDYDNGWY